MKYLFEVEEEITDCSKCPVRIYDSFENIRCHLTIQSGSKRKKTEWCPLQKVDDVLDEFKEALEEDKPVYHPGKHCGNCEYGNKYKEHEPCNSCKEQSNWKKRIFY